MATQKNVLDIIEVIEFDHPVMHASTLSFIKQIELSIAADGATNELERSHAHRTERCQMVNVPAQVDWKSRRNVDIFVSSMSDSIAPGYVVNDGLEQG